jgi:hypothetical protein
LRRDRVAYNSCRDRHCPKCQAVAAKKWLADRQAELLPVSYYHVVFTLPRPIADIAYQNKAVVYDLLLKVAAETLITIAADPKHLGARIGLTAVLHTWGSALTHHPHAHIIVPGGGFSLDGQHWVACRPGFFLSVRVLSRLFRRLFLEKLTAAYNAGRLEFFAHQAALAEPAAFKARLAAVRKVKWVVYAKRPFGGPDAVLAYLSRYTHRIAIANSRIVAFDGERVTFKWKDYRAKPDARYKATVVGAGRRVSEERGKAAGKGARGAACAWPAWSVAVAGRGAWAGWAALLRTLDGKPCSQRPGPCVMPAVGGAAAGSASETACGH